MSKFLQIYKGASIMKKCSKQYNHVIAFDLDETLGSFSHLYILWSAMHKIRKNAIFDEQLEFNELLDIYPEFLRYGILSILSYLLVKKKSGECDKIFIYTNNNCSPPWVSLIMRYFDYKLNTTNFFDKAIHAFKINNKRIEFSRTTNNKTHLDFINCVILPKTTQICFIDNTYYSEMVNDKVYYIQPLSYYHHLDKNTIIERFVKFSRVSHVFDTQNMLEDFIHDWFDMNNLPMSDMNTANLQNNYILDVFICQKIMYHIKEFFFLISRKNKTRKKNIRVTNTTRKNTSAK